MGHSNGAESASCRVLPIIDEEPESESESSVSSMSEDAPEAKMGIADRRRAIVSRMRELLRRAAAQSAQSRLRSTTLATAKKWKRVVTFHINTRDACARKLAVEQRRIHNGDAMSSSSFSSTLSNNSFSWDVVVAAGDCPSTGSPLWPAFVSAQKEINRMAQWITTDSDFVVLEL